MIAWLLFCRDFPFGYLFLHHSVFMSTDTSNIIFQQAISFVNQTNRHLFITGKAGTGKTTFLRYIREHSHKKMAVVAPTGVAAINAGGMTIHSFFQLPFGIFLPTDGGSWGDFGSEVNNRSTIVKNLRLRGGKKEVLRELDLLIIDEISMVRADLLDAIDTVLRHVRRQPSLPFGGVQMVFIGDLFQLPPVAKQEDWSILGGHYKSPFFFDAVALRQTPPLYIELKKIYRQKDDVFINILNNIRNNCCTPYDLEHLHQHYNPLFQPRKEENYITLTSHNAKADTINQIELNNLSGKIYFYQADITGEFYDRSFPADKELRLKVGAQVMFIKNDKGEARRYYNGKIGTVTLLEKEKISVSFPNETEEMELELEKWDNIRYSYNNQEDKLDQEELGTFTQYPIRLAWAITIHKSQGLTFERAIVDAGASFAAGQVYVSLSRLTALKGLVLHSRILPNCISTDSRVIEYVKAEKAEDELQQILEAEQRVYVQRSLLQSFAWQKIDDAIVSNLKEYEHRQFPDKEKCVKWAVELSANSVRLMEVTEKFSRQLEKLFVTCEQDKYKNLYERMEAATSYFVAEMDVKLVASTRKHINQVKVKQKVKRYVKELMEMALVFDRKKYQLQQALKLAEALRKSVDINALLQMVQQSKEPASLPDEKKETAKKSAKVEKGESGRVSLQLFKQGKSIADIAAERGMGFTTIEGHLSAFIRTGEVDVLDLVDNTTLEALIKIMVDEPELKHSELKQKAGESVSYGVIRAVAAYLELVKIKADLLNGRMTAIT